MNPRIWYSKHPRRLLEVNKMDIKDLTEVVTGEGTDEGEDMGVTVPAEDKE